MDDYNEIQLQNLMGTDDQDLESLMAEEFPQIIVEEELPMDLLNEYWWLALQWWAHGR